MVSQSLVAKRLAIAVLEGNSSEFDEVFKPGWERWKFKIDIYIQMRNNNCKMSMANNNQDQIDFGQTYTLSLSLFHLSVIIRKSECLKYLIEKNLSTDFWLEPLHFQNQTCIPPTAWSGHVSDILNVGICFDDPVIL